MKNKITKKFLMMMIIVILTIPFIGNVKAITVQQESSIVIKVDDSGEDVLIPLKTDGTNYLYCVDGMKATAPIGKSCVTSDTYLTEENRALIASIINYNTSSFEGDPYVLKELTISKYLNRPTGDTIDDKYNKQTDSILNGSNNSDNFKIYKSNFELKLYEPIYSDASVSSLQFVLDEDETDPDYIPMYITSVRPTAEHVDTIDYTITSVSPAQLKDYVKVVKSGDNYRIEFKEEDLKKITDVTDVSDVSVTVKFTAKQQAYKLATIYDCKANGDDYQNLASDGVAQQRTSTVEITATMKIEPEEKQTTKTIISKKSATTGDELPGAKLQILNEDGDILYEWISSDEPHEIEGLEPGIYYLKEIIAPKGYALSEEMIEFEISDEGEVTEVIMVNDLEVEVPDTLSSRSALLLTMAMFDIALGIGIISYVKKNKIEE